MKVAGRDAGKNVKCDEKDRGGVVNSRQEQLVELSGSEKETRVSRPDSARFYALGQRGRNEGTPLSPEQQ